MSNIIKSPEQWFRPLKEKDIEEKLALEKEAGRALKSTRELLQAELFLHERAILQTKYELLTMNWLRLIFKRKAYEEVLLSYEIQAQNLREQIAYIDKKLKES